jgi:hypothetical protein
MKIIDRTKLSDSATSYRIRIDAEDLNHEETPRERYDRYLKQARHDYTEVRGGKLKVTDDARRTATE